MPPYMMYRERFPRVYSQLRTKNHEEMVEFIHLLDMLGSKKKKLT